MQPICSEQLASLQDIEGQKHFTVKKFKLEPNQTIKYV